MSKAYAEANARKKKQEATKKVSQSPSLSERQSQKTYGDKNAYKKRSVQNQAAPKSNSAGRTNQAQKTVVTPTRKTATEQTHRSLKASQMLEERQAQKDKNNEVKQRLNNKYGGREWQERVSIRNTKISPETAKDIKDRVQKQKATPEESREIQDRLQKKYSTGVVEGGKHSKMDDVSQFVDDAVAKPFKAGVRQAAYTDESLWNKALRAPKFEREARALGADEASIKKANERRDLRDVAIRAKMDKEQENIQALEESQNSKWGKWAVQASSSAGGMVMDQLYGPLSLVHMGARVTEQSRGEVIKKMEPMKQRLLDSGYSQEEVDELFKDVDKKDLINALFQGGIEVGSEMLGGGIGLASKYLPGGGLLDKALSRVVGSKLGSSLLGKVALGTGEEILEEEVGNPLQALASNLIYGNELQRMNEMATGRTLANTLPQPRNKSEARLMAANVSSSDFMAGMKSMYKEAGVSDAEAEELATLTRDYFTAHLQGDDKKRDEIQKQMVDRLAGGEASLRERWTFQDAIDAAMSTGLMTAVTGTPGAITTSMQGNAYKNGMGMDKVRNLAQITESLSAENSEKARAIKDRIDAGEDLTGTQVYELIGWANEATEDALSRQKVRDDIVNRRMKEENIRVMVMDNNYNLGPATAERFEEIADQTADRAQSMKMDDMDAYLIGDTVAAFRTGTISAEQMQAIGAEPENSDNREIFREMTGINLDQFNVKDKSGNINIAESNIEMQNALFAQAAENFMESARIEQERWNNTERGAIEDYLAEGLGSEGDKALHDALESVDPRDQISFSLMARASQSVYEHARMTTDTWDAVQNTFHEQFPDLSMDALRGVYEAGQMDRVKAETPYLNASVKLGEALGKVEKGSAKGEVRGKFLNETERELTSTERIVVESLADQFNANITMVDAQDERLKVERPDGSVTYANASVDLKTGGILLGSDADISKVVHEVTHMGAKLAPLQYLDMAHYIVDKAYKYDPEGTSRRLVRYRNAYAGQNLTDSQIEEEMVADIVTDFMNDPVFIREISQERPNWAKRIYNAIVDILRKLRNILASGRITDPATKESFLEEIGAYEETRHLWLDMMREASENNAAIGLAEWENAAYRDSNETPAEHEEAVESGEISEGFGEESTRYSLRKEDPPKKTIKAYKVFVAFKNRPGELYPPMVASPGGMPTPVGRWVNADRGELARNKDGSLVTTKNGRVKVQEGGKGTNKGKGGSLAWRPGWHLGSYPDAKQFAVKDPETGEARTVFPPNFIWAECEIAADNDYQLEALSYGVTPKGKFDRTQAGLPYIPKDGYYKYRTNADPKTVPWLITGAMKVNRILNDEEAREICAQFGATPMRRAGGDIDLAEYGFEKGEVTPTSEEDLAKLPPATDYSDEIRNLPGYVQREVNFDDPQIQKELSMNGQDAEYYRGLYEEQKRFSLPEYTQEEMDEHRQYLIDTATEFYDEPYTEDPNESGFILPDGKLPRMGMYGSRADDHNLIIGAYDDIGYDTSMHPKADAMARFLNEGNIRYMPENGTIEFGTEIEPTYEQYARIRSMDYVNMIEFTNPEGETVDFKEYDGNRSGVINDIKRFYRNGKIGGSQLSQFRYSITPEMQETVLRDVSPDIRFSIPTFRNAQAKGKFIASLNGGKGGFAGLSEVESGKNILRRVMAAKHFSNAQINASVGFLEHMAKYLESDDVQMRYGFIGWDDITDASITVRKDADGKIISVVVSAMVVNGEYPVNFDMTTICNKREGVMEVIQELTRKYDADTGRSILNSIKLTDEKMWSINKALKAEGIDTACLGCFVEARRYYTNRFIDKIDEVWNSAVRQARRELGLPEEEYFDFAKGKKVSGEDYNQISDLWTAYDESTDSKRSPSQRIKILMDEIVKNKEVDSPYLKLISAEDILTPEGIRGFKELSTHNKDRDMVKMIKSIYGTSAPKEILAFTPYNSEIALLPDKIKGTPTDEYLKSIGGTRVQSFSDFKMEHFFDHLQMVADEAARGFVNHGYSKVIAYPRLFGLTGRKINMSVMFDVLPASEWQSVLGCDDETALKVARKYQGLRFVTEKPKENADNRPYKEVTIEGVHGYLTYLVSDADYVNSVFDRLYQENLDAGMSEAEARRKANTDKPFEQSINYREAVELENREGYKENVGIIAVAFGDEHLRMLLDDPNVRYIIPYHRSGLPVFIAQKTALDIARNFTDFQNTNKAKGGYWINPDGSRERMKTKYEKFRADNPSLKFPAIEFFEKEINGKNYSVEFGKKNSKEKVSMAGTADFDVYENLENVKDIREISNAYLEHCIEKNYVPVFHEFAGHPNYYKMLFDFAVTDGTTTNIYPQKAVRNRYPGLDLDEIVKSGRTIEDLTDADFKPFYDEVERGLADQNAKAELRRTRLGMVINEDLLSANGENSIISDSNVQHIVNGTPDYTSVRYGNEEVTPEKTSEDIRRSISVDLDDDYMDAVNNGNMEEAQRLVDEAADKAGFKPVHRFHGTMNAGFSVFDKAYAKVGGNSGAGFYFSTDEDDSVNHYADVEGADNYFKWSELAEQIHEAVSEGEWGGYPELGIEPDDIETYEDAEEAAKKILNRNPGTYDVYLNYKNPYIRDYKNSTNIYDALMDDFDESVVDRDDYEEEWEYEDALWEAKAEHLSEALYGSVYGAYQDMENNYEVTDIPYIDDVLSKITEYAFDGSLTWEDIESGITFAGEVEVTNPEWTDSGYATPELTRAIIENLGFDAIEDKEVSRKFGQLSREMMTDTEHIIVFKPEQIKLSDPVTYAEDGSVIPLSERFDPASNDIRYSMPTMDSDDNILSDGQMEYFKNSQARDEQGRLVPVYHSTTKGGFTIFNPQRSDDHRSLFFTSNRGMSESYLRGHLTGDINPYTGKTSSHFTNINQLPFDKDTIMWSPEKVDEVKDSVSNIKVWDYDGIIAEGDDIVEVAKAVYESLTSLGLDEEWLQEIYGINRSGLYEGLNTTDDLDEAVAAVAAQFGPVVRLREALRVFEALNSIEGPTTEDGKMYAYSMDYVRGSSRVGTYSCYLNLENPLIVDAEGHYWSDIRYGGSSGTARNIRFYADPEWDQTEDGDPQLTSYVISFEYESLNDKGEWQLNTSGVNMFNNPNPSNTNWFPTDEAATMLEDNGLPAQFLHTMLFEADENPMDGSLEYISEEDEEISLQGAYTTRQLAKVAEGDGNDGVIIKNVRDYAAFGFGDEPGDVYIAFSSDQVKDVRNTDPTNNPDIRYSVATDDDAMDYMQSYARTTDDLWSNDPAIMEGRIRYSMSKQDYINGVTNKWNPAWKTEGHVLDEKNVEDQIRQVIMGAMRDSDTTVKYRQRTVKETVSVARRAYDLLKSDKHTEAAEMLYDHALNIVENLEFFGNNDQEELNRWKELRDYCRTTKFTVPADKRSDMDYAAFRKRNYGSILLGENGTAPDVAWQELNKIWPEMFGEDLKRKGKADEIMLQIEQALKVCKPLTEAYSSEYCMEFAGDIADDLFDIIYNGKEWHSLADRYDERAKAMKSRHEEAMRQMRDNINAMRETHEQEIAQLKATHRQDLKTQRMKADFEIAELKQNREYNIKRLKQEKARAVQEAKQKASQKEAEEKERRTHRQLHDRVLKEYKELTDRLLNPSKDRMKNIPEAIRVPLANMLACFDLEKESSKKLEEKYGVPTKAQLNFRELKDAIVKVGQEESGSEYDLLAAYLDPLMSDIAAYVDGKTIDYLTSADIGVIHEMMKGLLKAMRNHQRLEIEGENAEAQVIRNEVGEGAAERERVFGKAKKRDGGLIAALDAICNMGELTPTYFFRQIKGIDAMYREIRRGFDEYVRNDKMIMDKITEILEPYYKFDRKGKRKPGSEIEEWRHSESAQTFDLEHGTITLTIAQRMSLYCLSKRAQAKGHMMSEQGGIVASETTAGSRIAREQDRIKGKVIDHHGVVLTDADIQTIIQSLSPEQIVIADRLQSLMSNEMADLGNSASLKLLDIKMYKEKDYFPIKVVQDTLPTSLDKINIKEKVRNPGFSKPLTPGANNTIVVDDIFTVVASHCNEMNQYASYAVPLTNFMKVYNGSVELPDGTMAKVKSVIRQAYGDKAIKYIENFIDDINGNSFKRSGGLDGVLDKALGQAKKAAVFANLRVALQQPTAIVRAFAVMDPKYFKGVRPSGKATEEMQAHCPIAQWKSWGYYDTHFGRDIEDVMMGTNVPSKIEYFMSEVYGEFDNMTWGKIWQAVKNEIKATHKDVQEGSEEFWNLCNERASHVFDSTQVVDSPFHRSNDMRSKNGLVKQLTSFQAEPTLSFNVLRQGVVDWVTGLKQGNKKEAWTSVGRVLGVWIAQAAVVAVAQSLVDTLRRKRRKGADDDDDPAVWYEQMMSLFKSNMWSNFIDDVNPLNNIYWVKDIFPPIFNALRGEYVYGSSNLAYQWIDTLTKGIQKCKKKWEKGASYKTSWYDCLTDLLGGFGSLLGVPVKTMMRGGKNFFYWMNEIFGVNVFADDGSIVDDAVESLAGRFRKNKGDASSGEESEGEEKTFESELMEGVKIVKAGQKTVKDVVKHSPKTEKQMLDEIDEKTLGLTGQARLDKIWNIVGQGYTDYVDAGDYEYLARIRRVIASAGGNVDAFDQKVFAASKTALKKSIVSDPTPQQIDQQKKIRDYLLENGMTEAEISSEIVYKSYTARDLKAAFRLGNEDYIIAELRPLIQAGLTYEDFEKLYKYRNYGAKTYDGKYAQPQYRTSTGKYTWPISGEITSDFGHRSSPGGIGSTNHMGIDIGGNMGDPIGAADGGTVVYVGWYGGAGNTVFVQHDDGTVTQYSHMSAFNCKKGDQVAQGQTIGLVGSTGNSTGPHCHFGVVVDGQYVDPRQYLGG